MICRGLKGCTAEEKAAYVERTPWLHDPNWRGRHAGPTRYGNYPATPWVVYALMAGTGVLLWRVLK